MEDNWYNSLQRESQEYFTYYFSKIIKNSEILLLEYDMLDEFKKWNYDNFFSLIDYDIKLDLNIICVFIEDVISCCLSQDSDTKRRNKYEIQQQLKQKEQELLKQKEQEYKEKIYRKEYKCMLLLNKIEENKYKTEDLYLEYNKILELKKIYDIPRNISFLEYFTADKILYLEILFNIN